MANRKQRRHTGREVLPEPQPLETTVVRVGMENRLERQHCRKWLLPLVTAGGTLGGGQSLQVECKCRAGRFS